ncbi:MAG: tetratricopeptide repeat protein, partial [Planctomycetota bacterium]
MRTPLLFTLLLFTLLPAFSVTPALGHRGGEDELGSVPDEVRQHLMHGRWEEAIARIDDLADEKPEDMDLWMYLQAVAREHKGDLEDALTTLKGLERTYPESAWVHKARFRRAEIHRRRREFQAAEALYEEGLQRLRSEERQGELADIYVSFADELSTQPAVVGPEASGVDYGRAHALYQKVLSLGAPRATRDHAMFRMAFCMEQTRSWKPARDAWESYLAEFDPTRQRPLLAGFEAGAKVWEARYQLGLAELMAGQGALARRTLEDLVSDLRTALSAEGSSLPAQRAAELGQMEGDARFDIARTYSTSGDGPLMAVAAYRRFLETHPNHARGTRAAQALAGILRGNQRAQEAVAAYQAVIERPAPTGVSSEVSEEHARLVMGALHLKGSLLQGLGRYDEAIESYEEYTRRYPSGPSWAAAQQGMLDSRYQVGVAHREEERFDAAREAWTSFLEEHPLDGRAREIQFDLGVLHLEQAAALSEEDEDLDVSEHLRAAIARWEALTKKYPGTEEASHALFQTGVLRETELDELEQAIEAYRACNFGRWAGAAAQRLRQMTEPSLQVITERTWRADEAARIKLRVRNVEEFEVEVYALDLEAYFRKHLTHRRIEDLDLDLIAADRRIEVAVENYRRYAPIETEFELPVQGPGVWAVAVTADELRATTLVLRSDVEVVVKSSRREVFVFAQDMRAEAPAQGVKVLVGLPLVG